MTSFVHTPVSKLLENIEGNCQLARYNYGRRHLQKVSFIVDNVACTVFILKLNNLKTAPRSVRVGPTVSSRQCTAFGDKTKNHRIAKLAS
jgi:hypothetical protein